MIKVSIMVIESRSHSNYL